MIKVVKEETNIVYTFIMLCYHRENKKRCLARIGTVLLFVSC